MTDPDAVQPPTPAPEPGAADAPDSRARRRETAACDALRTLMRDYYLYHFGARPPQQEDVPISLSLTVRPSQAWSVAFDPPFVEQIQGQLEDVQAGHDAYRRGRVHCFRCRSSQCEHSAPPDALSVFRAYTSTGVPEWCEMVQALIEARHEQVDRLYAAPPAVLALVQLGRDLKARQLSSFGKASKTYAILGQVVAGYFLTRERRGRNGESGQRFAVTFQAAEIRAPDGRLQLKLNPVVGGMTPDEWDELLVSGWRPWVARACEQAVRAVALLEQQAHAARDSGDPEQIRRQMRKLPQILNHLARSVEQGDRQSARRTQHVEDRRQQQRPIHKALDDAKAATAENLFYDEKRETVVACGKQGRAHVFSHDGRHVTSFVLAAGGADFRVRTQRWRPLQKNEIEEFRATLASLASGSEPVPAGGS